MNAYEMFHSLMKVKEHVLTIKTKSDSLDKVDDVTAAQYGIQGEMTAIIDPLLELLSKICCAQAVDVKSSITTEVFSTYLPGEDKTLVWRYLYVNGNVLVEELAGWYHGEPNEQSTKDFSGPTNTAYFI